MLEKEQKLNCPKTVMFLMQKVHILPRLVDIHNHGCPDFWFYENPKEASRYFLKHGVTTVLPTFIIQCLKKR